MVSIHSEDENAFLKTFTRRFNYYCLGGSRKEFNDTFIWNDGSNFSFTKWCGREPDQFNEQNSSCMSVFTGDEPKWFDGDCYIERFQLCQKDVEIKIPQCLPSVDNCYQLRHYKSNARS
ncbi:ladderlectin-like protein [Leptotrombidium deliense]|uniref:Ladderlectin-like protein n=1 Tax=Leptotrombidium deliense TaxID=299467 RepID=A0A443RVR6_9ACAR|nr:ladderlectin-like protein [Leptotrombidium deliense]